MRSQLSLPGFDDPPDGGSPAEVEPWDPLQGPAKLFFALRPQAADVPVVAKVAADLHTQNGLNAKLLEPTRLHITLQVVGDYRKLARQEVILAKQWADTVISPAFDLVLDHAMTFRGNGAYVLCVGEGAEEIKALWQRLGIAMRRAGRKVRPITTPHMTLSYKGLPMAEHPTEPIRLRMDEFVLINSHTGRAFHEVVGCWPLVESR